MALENRHRDGHIVRGVGDELPERVFACPYLRQLSPDCRAGFVEGLRQRRHLVVVLDGHALRVARRRRQLRLLGQAPHPGDHGPGGNPDAAEHRQDDQRHRHHLVAKLPWPGRHARQADRAVAVATNLESQLQAPANACPERGDGRGRQPRGVEGARRPVDGVGVEPVSAGTRPTTRGPASATWSAWRGKTATRQGPDAALAAVPESEGGDRCRRLSGACPPWR